MSSSRLLVLSLSLSGVLSVLSVVLLWKVSSAENSVRSLSEKIVEVQRGLIDQRFSHDAALDDVSEKIKIVKEQALIGGDEKKKIRDDIDEIRSDLRDVWREISGVVTRLNGLDLRATDRP